MVWDFIQNQLLGMKWLTVLIQKLLTAWGLDVTTRIGGSLVFFLMDVIKISILLCVLIFIISYIQTFFPPEKSRKIMGRFGGMGARIMGALLGTVTPFCSCSSIFEMIFSNINENLLIIHLPTKNISKDTTNLIAYLPQSMAKPI